MNQFYSEILIAGEGTDYTNIPEESSIPLENIKNEGTAVKHPKSEKENNSNTQNNGENKVLFIIHIVGSRLFLSSQVLLYLMMPQVQIMKVNITFVGNYLKQKLEEKE